MSAVDPKYLVSSPSNQSPCDKEKTDDNVMHGTDNEVIPLKVDDDDGKAHSLAPPAKGTNPKKKAKNKKSACRHL